MEEFIEFDPQKTQTCPTIGKQIAKVCLPVKVSPFAVTGPAKIKCFGEPIIEPGCNHCHGRANGTCDFTISQKLRVEIPVEFGATVNTGDTFIDCDCKPKDDYDDSDEHDCNCDKEEDY